MYKITFMTSLLFTPLAYHLHHFEESVLLNFRAWRSLYFPDSNPLPTETVLIILTTVTMVYLITHSIVKSRASAQIVILFLMATQVNNVLFHAGSSIFFQHYSPGTITALLLYLPVNVLVFYKALEENFITIKSGIFLFIMGGAIFWLFELVGPVFIAVAFAGSYLWLAFSMIRKSGAEA